MKRLKSYWYKYWGWLLSTLLTVLGVTSCEEIDPEDMPLMYGTPTASFSIKGKVENVRGQALSGVRVVIPYSENCQRTTENFIPDHLVIINEIRDTVYTNTEGRFEWRGGSFPSDTVRYELQFHDIHPEAGRVECQVDTLKVSFLREDLKKTKGGDWDFGHAEKEITVILKDKEDEQ